MKSKKIDLKKEIKHLKQTIALKCLDCVSCQPKEILKCQISGCPLWGEKPKELKGVYSFIKVLKKKNPGFYEAK